MAYFLFCKVDIIPPLSKPIKNSIRPSQSGRSPVPLSNLHLDSRHMPVCQERKGRKGKDSEERMARKVFALG